MTDQLLEGMDVYDIDGLKVGKVVKYDTTLGYVETLGTFSGPRFIPSFRSKASTSRREPQRDEGDRLRHLPQPAEGHARRRGAHRRRHRMSGHTEDRAARRRGAQGP